jgi:hypothetical protein
MSFHFTGFGMRCGWPISVPRQGPPSGARSWCSHADAATYHGWNPEAGPRIDSEDFVPDAYSGYQLLWGTRTRRSGDGVHGAVQQFG